MHPCHDATQETDTLTPTVHLINDGSADLCPVRLIQDPFLIRDVIS